LRCYGLALEPVERESPLRRCVLVTGASGFIGSALVRALAADGWNVRAAQRSMRPDQYASLVSVALMPDLGKPCDWAPLLEGVTHIVHLAGIAHATSRLPADLYDRVNAQATRELVVAATRRAIERFVFVSSVRAQSGPSSFLTLTESDPPMPSDAYGRSKLAAEGFVVGGNLPSWSIVRPVLVYGPGVKGNLALLQHLAQLPIPLPMASLHNRRSILGLTNLCSILSFCLDSRAAHQGLFLAADPGSVTIADLMSTMRAAVGRKPRLFPMSPQLIASVLGLVGRPGMAQSLLSDLVIDTSRLHAAGWSPVAGLSEEIGRMMDQPRSPLARR
jgi:nucleoside-diphosphate-sugar epimerase